MAEVVAPTAVDLVTEKVVKVMAVVMDQVRKK